VPGATAATIALERFVHGARDVDARLHEVARRVNGDFHDGTFANDAATVDAWRSADPTILVPTIPGGMPPELLRRTMLVYSDLVSRWYAMRRVEEAQYQVDAQTFVDDVRMCLREGHDAAAHFDDDLARLRDLAGATAPFVVAAADSRATGEVAVHAAVVRVSNGGCDSCGGHRYTALRPITWDGPGGSGPTRVDGHVDTMEFDAVYANGAWEAHIHVC
jgi:hypothetical protein